MNDSEFEYLGPYKVERTLGRGGMGTVYKGVHARSGEAIAIKVIASGVANSPRFRRRFASEVETLQRLKHPHIVSLVGFGEEQGLLFYTMEYVEGHSLHDHLRQHIKMPWEEVVQVGIETASALKHAHDLGIIHRDLKPANLMLNEAGAIKLTDFGIAKLFGSSDMTAVGSVIGTADYMPPEQAEGKPVTTRSDLYSLGGVLYALLCGKAPFGGKSVPEVLYSVRYNAVPSLIEREPDVPPELAELIHELLAKDMQSRPPTALVVGNRLKSIQHAYRARGDGLKGPMPGVDKQSDESAPKSRERVATHLTSLDLSDVDDEELRLTGAEVSSLGLADDLDKPDETGEKLRENDAGLGTHEQQTMLAPDDYVLPPAEAPAAPDPRRESELSGEFHDSPSQEEPLTSTGPSHYTPIEHGSNVTFATQSDPEEESAGTDWLQIGSMLGIVGLLIGSCIWGWWMLQPDSADELYASIQAAAESGEDGQLLAARSQVDEFLQRFPDDERFIEVEALADEAELARRTRVLARRASRAGGADQLSALEQSFLDCMETRANNRVLAAVKMQAFLRVYSGLENLSATERQYVDLIDFAARGGETKQPQQILAATLELEKLIQAADKALTDERRQAYYRDLILLYGDKTWANEQIAMLKKKLDAES